MIGNRCSAFPGVLLLTMLAGCNAQFKELPETDAVISCREQGFQRGSLAFRDCVGGGVEAIEPVPEEKHSP